MKLKLLKLFRSVWIGAFSLLMFVSIIGIFIGAESFWAAWGQLVKIFSPFNVVNWLLIGICISPALIANHLIQKLEENKT